MNAWPLWIGFALIMYGFWLSLVEHEDDAGWLLTFLGTSTWWIAAGGPQAWIEGIGL